MVAHPVLKVLTAEQWDQLRAGGLAAGAPVDVADGYVHLSTPTQVGETIAKHFAEHRDLVVLTLDAVELGEALLWEPSRGGQDFPHLYGPLRVEDVRGVRRLSSVTWPTPDPDPDSVDRWSVLDAVAREADERMLLVSLLDWYRDGIAAKVAGLSDEDARRRLVPSASTVIGLVRHLALVEDWWFEHQFSGDPWREPWGNADWDADKDWEFTSARSMTMADVLVEWREAVARSRAITEAASLDDVGAVVSEDRGPFTLRWLLLHMLEEYARHLGHLDILRELTDGVTGQ